MYNLNKRIKSEFHIRSKDNFLFNYKFFETDRFWSVKVYMEIWNCRNSLARRKSSISNIMFNFPLDPL